KQQIPYPAGFFIARCVVILGAIDELLMLRPDTPLILRLLTALHRCDQVAHSLDYRIVVFCNLSSAHPSSLATVLNIARDILIRCRCGNAKLESARQESRRQTICR